MQVVKKVFIFLVVLWFALLFFMPKQELYYKLEQELTKNAIELNEKSFNEGFFSFTLNKVDIYAKGIKLASAEKVHFFTLLFYNTVSIQQVVLDDSLKSIAPTHIDNIEINYALWDPLHVKLEARGNFAKAVGNISLSKQVLRVDFNGTKGIEMLQPQLKQDKKGWHYETSF